MNINGQDTIKGVVKQLFKNLDRNDMGTRCIYVLNVVLTGMYTILALIVNFK